MAGETKAGMWTPTPQRKQKRKEKLLECLNKLGDRDTQRTASEEIKAFIKELEPDGMTVLISSLCSSGKEHKPFVRKECIRLFSNLTEEECPVRGNVLTHPQITRIIKYLRSCLQDSDGGVREAVAEVYGIIARHWVEHHGCSIPGEPSNLFVKSILEAVGDPKKDVQIAACSALGQISDSVGPISKDLAKELLRWLKNSHFSGKAQLIAAICSIEHGEINGLMKNSMNSLKPFLNHIVGQPSSGANSGSGFLGLLASKDWPIRRAAAEGLKTAAVLYGPQFTDAKTGTSLVKKAKAALGSAKFDKVKPVREAILDAFKALETLENYMEANRDPDDWVTFWDSRGNETSSPKPTGASTPTPLPSERVRRNEDPDKSTCVERFRKAGVEVDVIAAPEITQEAPDSTRDEDELDEDVETPRASEMEDEDEEVMEKVPDEQWAEMVDRMEAMERQQNRLFEMVEALGNRIDTSVMDLQGDFSVMRQAVCVLQEDMAALIGDVTQRSSCVSDFRRSVGSSQAIMEHEKSTSPTLADLDGAYAEAVSIPNNELQLIRLIQRTGPVIPELNLSTLNHLLRVFHQFLWEGRALGRILPWLWQLVEPQNREHANAVEGETRIKIIGVLSELKREAGEEVALQIQSMESSLRAIWDMPAPRDVDSKPRYTSSAGRLAQSSRQTFDSGMTDRTATSRYGDDHQAWVRSSVEGLDELQARFNGMNHGMRGPQ